MRYDDPDISIDEELEYAGLVRRSDLPDINHAIDHLIGLRDALLKTGNRDDVWFHLEEVCGVFDIELHDNPEVKL